LTLLKNGKYLASVSGKLSMHGETKDVTAPVTFTVNNGMITATSEFKIMLEDYKILIPSLVKDKISKGGKSSDRH
jgi:polyisoprenoid-binding protein YceI